MFLNHKWHLVPVCSLFVLSSFFRTSTVAPPHQSIKASKAMGTLAPNNHARHVAKTTNTLNVNRCCNSEHATGIKSTLSGFCSAPVHTRSKRLRFQSGTAPSAVKRSETNGPRCHFIFHCNKLLLQRTPQQNRQHPHGWLHRSRRDEKKKKFTGPKWSEHNFAVF